MVVVHRPAYDDWTFPKGKVDPGESVAEAAVREVREEASVDVTLGVPLAQVDYQDRQGRPKVVHYWTMTVSAGSVGGDHEVDEARWVSVAEARDRLSYQRDQPVLDALLALAAGGALDAPRAG